MSPPPKDPFKREESLKRMSEAQKRRFSRPEEREKARDRAFIVQNDPEVRKKKSDRMIGKTVSEETKEKHREMWRQPGFREQWLGTNNPAKKPEVRIKMRMAKLGTTVPEKTRKLMSESHIGLERTKEHCENLSRSTKESWNDPILRESRTGKNHFNWKGGISFEPYCPKFNDEFRERVRAFFGYQCQYPGCGHVWQPGERRLAIHHANYRKESCCDPNVKPIFVPVCSGSCHGKTNHNRERCEKYFTKLINEKYNGKCYFTKEEMILRCSKK